MMIYQHYYQHKLIFLQRVIKILLFDSLYYIISLIRATKLKTSTKYIHTIIQRYNLYNYSYTSNISKYIIHYKAHNISQLPNVDCTFLILNTSDTILVDLNISRRINTNRISPLYYAKWNMDTKKIRILDVPPDNDLQSLYISNIVDKFTTGTSSYVSAFYDGSGHTNNGLILGFLEHDLWKTGIEYSSNAIGAVAGINGILLTRDTEPHGIVSITRTPTLFIHYNNDWRKGMEKYADMIAEYTSHALETNLLPFSGWNSWAMAIGHIGQPTIKNLFGASDVIHNLSNYGLGPNQYIVRDAVYNLNESDTKKWVSHVNGYENQFSGTYSSPFVIYMPDNGELSIGCDSKWCDNIGDNCWLIEEIILKDRSNNPVRPIAKIIKQKTNTRILDVTHPAAICILNNTVNLKKSNNMTLIKYDFLNWIAYEGQRYNMTLAPTGMSAYLYGINLIYKLWNESNHRVILNYGISLPLPIGRGMNTRRHGCDQMFGGVLYTMNQYAGGWWLNRFYLLDPDLVSFQEDYWFDPKLKKITSWLNMDSKSRVAKAVVYGGEFKNGDDLTNISNIRLVNTYMGNSRVNSMWSRFRIGKSETAFRPISWTQHKIVIPLLSSIIPPEIYIRENGDICIFNFGIIKELYTINLHETNLDLTKIVKCKEIWDYTSIGIIFETELFVGVEPKSSVLIECRNYK